MTTGELFQLVLYFGVLTIAAALLGGYMARVYSGQRSWLSTLVQPLENILYRAAGVNPSHEMTWRSYAAALLAFNVLGFAVVFALQLAQAALPPQSSGFAGRRTGVGF